MSTETYNDHFHSTLQYLSATLLEELPTADRRLHRPTLALLHLRYVHASNRLATAVDQLVQPQKLRLARHLLELALGRLLELRHDLAEADLVEFAHSADAMARLGLTPPQTELAPRVFAALRRGRGAALRARHARVDRLLAALGCAPAERRARMPAPRALLVLQAHERARQGRLRAQLMREARGARARPAPAREGAALGAALRIQRLWRGYVARRATRRRKLEEMVLIGMVAGGGAGEGARATDEETKARRRRLQAEGQAEFEAETERVRAELEVWQRGALLERMSDEMRGWMMEYREQTGKIPEMVGSERSGSRMLASRQGTDSEVSKSSSSRESKRKEAKSGEAEEEEESTKAIVSAFVGEMNAKREEYEEVWSGRVDRGEGCDLEMVMGEEVGAMEAGLKKIVDDMMKAELVMLQEAMDRDRGHKGRKKTSKKVRKGGKKSKKKKEKDLTPDRTTESLFEELVANGIIKNYPNVRFADFKGERSSWAAAPHDLGAAPPPALGDVRRLLAELCALPLAGERLHRAAPLARSVLVAGARGSGKRTLVRAVCAEAGALLLDLTPANVVGKYPGKGGLVMLVHLVTKVARLLQPAVIYMGCAERPFVKKVPKADKSDPKRLKKDLPKIVKNFCPEERVMLIGTTSCPWECDQKLLQQVYHKFVLIPKPDYGSRYCAWTHLLGRYGAIGWQFDASALCKASDGYTVGAIAGAFADVMTVKRMLQLRVQPLSALEVANALAARAPIYREEEEAFAAWWARTPMERRRARAIEARLEAEAESQAKQANKKS